MDIVFVKLQAPPQHIDRSGKIPDLCLVEAQIVIHIRKRKTFSLYPQVKTTVGTDLHSDVHNRFTIHTVHSGTLLFLFRFCLVFLFWPVVFHHFFQNVDHIRQITAVNRILHLVHIETRFKLLQFFFVI